MFAMIRAVTAMAQSSGGVELDAGAWGMGGTSSSNPVCGVAGEARPWSPLLTTALFVSLWMATGGLALAIVGGLGAHPVRRLVIGAVLVGASAVALWRREDVEVALRQRPWLVVPLAAVELAAGLVDDVAASPYLAFSMTAAGLAVVVARTRTVWACVGLLVVGYAAAVLITRPDLADGRDVAGVLGQLLSYPSVAVVLLGLRRLYWNFTDGVDARLEEIRAGAPALTTALSRAIERGHGGPIALLPAACPLAALTATEREVVEALVKGRAAKQVAADRRVSLATIRSHIKHAKRKTGARTLSELVAIAARAGDRSVV